MLGDAILFVGLNVSAALCGLGVALSLRHTREPWRIWLMALAIYGVTAHFAVLILGILGLLNPGAALVLTLIALAAVFSRLRHAEPVTPSGNGAGPSTGNGPFLLVATCLLVGTVAVNLYDTGYNPVRFKFDDFTYHATVAAQWVLDERFSIIPSTYQVYYPFGAEVISIWYMLPFGDDAFTSLAGGYWLALAAVAVFGLVRLTGGGLASAMLLTAVLLASDEMMKMAQSFSANDLAGSALFVAALAVLAPPADRPAPDDRLPEFCSCGLLIGMAVGAKVTFVVASLVLFGWLVACRQTLVPGLAWWRLILVFGALAALTGSYWYIRNWVIAGNPLFPAEVGPFWGPFDSETRALTTAANWISQHGFDLWDMRKIFNWPPPTGLLAVLGYAVFLGTFIWRGSSHAAESRARGVAIVLCIAGLLTIALLWVLPFSGTFNRPYAELSLRAHYANLFVIGGLVLAWPLLEHQRPRIALLFRALAVLGIISGVLLQMRFDPLLGLPMLLGAAVGFILYYLPRWHREWGRRWPIYASLIATLVFTSGATLYTTKLAGNGQSLYATGQQGGRPTGAAWKALDSLPAGSRLSFFMSEPTEHTNYYPLFGRNLQHRVVYIDGDGRERVAMHQIAPADSPAWFWEWEQRDGDWGRRKPDVTPAELIDNLREAGVDFVVVSQWKRSHWPPQQAMLVASGAVEPVYEDGYTTIWRVADEADTPSTITQ